MHKYLKISVFISGILLPVSAIAFSFEFVQQHNYDLYDPAGFISGIWHGLIAPWSLIGRWFFDNVGLYAYSNTGWFYDAGFILGVGASMPIGWLAALVATFAMF
jgi:hypothetical protein